MRRHVLHLSEDDLDPRERRCLDWARRYLQPVTLRGGCWRLEGEYTSQGKSVYRLWSLPSTFCYGTPAEDEDVAAPTTPRRPSAR